MVTKAISLALGLTALPVSASDMTPEAVVHQLFDAMRAGDGVAILQFVHEDAPLERLMNDGSVKKGSFREWAGWIDTLGEGDADEQVFAVKTFYGAPGLATVSAPFVIYLHGKLVGCGVNQFSFADTTEGWRVIHGIDVPHDGDCETYRDDYMVKARSIP
ncbi:hypothetical protein [Kordiimonas aestuarii]|uniref:hypothetical protein n=1 Tax=Kordiimonas aestuarii TaxID=1005925 RepID=UPI0021CF410E|nr:hypothetical protein [Kordiimonas aestuarii]